MSVRSTSSIGGVGGGTARSYSDAAMAMPVPVDAEADLELHRLEALGQAAAASLREILQRVARFAPVERLILIASSAASRPQFAIHLGRIERPLRLAKLEHQ